MTIKAHRDNPLPQMAGTGHLGYSLAELGAGDLLCTVTLPKDLFYLAVFGAEKERLIMPRKRLRETPPAGANQPKYSITTAAELTGVHPQQLRRYEKAGMLSPQRSPGGTRRYSDADLAQVARIRDLSDAGVNEAGIGQILSLQDALKASNARAAAAEARAKAAEEREARARARKRQQKPPSPRPE